MKILDTKKNKFVKGTNVFRFNEKRYKVYADLGLYDRNGLLMHEGDIAVVRDKEADIPPPPFSGLITYVSDIGSFVLLNYKSECYYPITKDLCRYMTIIGNIISEPELLAGYYDDKGDI